MKRKTPLTRKAALKQGEPLERKPLARKTPMEKKGNGLARRSPPRAKPKPPREELEIRLSRTFWEEVTGKGKKRCVKCGSARHVQAHHVISQQAIKRYCREHRVEPEAALALLWNVHNGMCLCESCHMNHEAASARVPRYLVTSWNLMFADFMGLRHLIERYYPEDP